MAQRRFPETGQTPSWGLAAGLLTGCGVTLIGVALGLPPFTILGRAFGGGTLVTIIVSLMTVGWQLITPPPQEDE